MENYVIYTITNDDFPNDFYVGSTDNFEERKTNHRKTCNNPKNKGYNIKVYKFIRENGGWKKWKMQIIKDCGEITEIQAKQIEEEFRINLCANLNTRRAYLTEEQRKELNAEYRKENKQAISEQKKEYREENKQAIAEKQKEYREENKQAIAEKHKEYYEENKQAILEKVKEYQANNKQAILERKAKHYQNNKQAILEKGKEYQAKNKQAILEQKKEYYEENKQAILERRKEKYKEKITCECGCIVSCYNLAGHRLSQKHINLMQK